MSKFKEFRAFAVVGMIFSALLFVIFAYIFNETKLIKLDEQKLDQVLVE